MAVNAHPAPTDALHRAWAATWHVIVVIARAVARFAVAVVTCCRGGEDCESKRLSRAERKRLRKAKLRRLLGRRTAA